MLRDIHLHVDSDETRQQATESKLSERIYSTKYKNINAFQRYIPSVLETLPKSPDEHSSVLCNRYEEINIVDYGTGQVLYGYRPEEEVRQEVDLFLTSGCRINLDNENAAVAASQCKVEQSVPLVVVLGVGLGYHLELLLEQRAIRNLIIYEPNVSYFKCSLHTISWQRILRKAQKEGIALFFQLGQDGSSLYSDITELREQVSIPHFYLYKHYNAPSFVQLMEAVYDKPWSTLNRFTVAKTGWLDDRDFLPLWTHSLNADTWSKHALDQNRFNNNLRSLEKFFPDLYKEFKDYTPAGWVPQANTSGEVNLVYKKLKAPLYSSSPVSDCEESIAGFSERPNRDGLVLGYKGKKLKRYTHYKLVKKIENVLDDVEFSHGALPDTINSLIIFGLGAGYQLPHLLKSHAIDKLFICEPSRDYFYCSLFAIDWYKIFETLDEAGSRLYINVGDDGNHLIKDLVTHFHSIGPYVLANTYFYQGYFNKKLVAAISQLREQLQVIIAMGDYYDHSRYGIAHTTWGVRNNIPLLRKDAGNLLPLEKRDFPVFVVGNGPSLDTLIPLVREHQNSALIVSCGTALQTLYRHGITPDFHAEIETNRSTFDWTVRVGDLDYLKQITLISCNGMHPDTIGLFKTALLALKEGESATVSLMELFPEHGFDLLENAYPTVVNFVMNWLMKLDFRQLYLFGVDMGFVDPKHHHSKDSGYYDNQGKERFDYEEENDTSIVVEGNFRPTVRTKYEFKVSKSVLEKTIKPACDVYNLNDGARIAGALPLRPEDVLIIGNSNQKKDLLEKVMQSCFLVMNKDEFERRRASRYDSDQLVEELDALYKLVQQRVESKEEAEALVENQRNLLVLSYQRRRSLLFFYLNGTMNFVNSAMVKTLTISNENAAVEAFNRIKSDWEKTVFKIKTELELDEDGFDFISTFEQERRKAMFPIEAKAMGICLQVSNHRVSKEIHQDVETCLATLLNCEKIDAGEKYEIEVVFPGSKQPPVISDYGNVRRVHISHSPREAEAFFKSNTEMSTQILYLPHSDSILSPMLNDMHAALLATIAATGSKQFKLILPKLLLENESQATEIFGDLKLEKYFAYDCYKFVGFTKHCLPQDSLLFRDGTRARLITDSDYLSELVFDVKPRQVLEDMIFNNKQSFPSLEKLQ